MSFKDLNLDPTILEAIENAGYCLPTPIQYKAIPKILGGIDLCASAQTGTGKTASFILPALQRLLTPSAFKVIGPRILILVPTRELAMQVASQAVKYSQNLSRVKTVCIYGGAPYPIQNRQLSRPYEILVATPGRLIDHLESGRINFSRLEMLILDEADRMLDMGFIKPVEQIAAATPKSRQTLMFSATFGKEVLKLSERLLNKPLQIKASEDKAKHENIEQYLAIAGNLNDKYRTIEHILNDPAINQAIIFTSTKRQADLLSKMLTDSNYPAAALHGDMDQRQRTRTVNALRNGEKRILVATDVAARGIDILSISHVINFDLPNSVEDYVHRIGRTGRATAKGIAISLATPKEFPLIRRIEQYTGHRMASLSIPGLEGKFHETNRSTVKENKAPPKKNKRHFHSSRKKSRA